VNTSRRRTGLRIFRDYLLGLALIVASAALTEWTGSLIPLALAGSAALLLTVSLVRHIAGKKRAEKVE
jgi:hypothetical protein